jgi:adenylosuccinate synthase
VIDLLRPELLRSKLRRAIEEKNILFQHFFNANAIDLESTYEECLKMGQQLKPFVTDVRKILNDAFKNQQSILFEGAQGTLLDVDHGTYPFVTSSNTIAAGALSGSGMGIKVVDQIIGIIKAYTTRVGTGPFPTELEKTDPPLADLIRRLGQEFGSTTGRPRRIGWLDLVALKYAVQVNSLTGLALMKADVLQNFSEIQVCTSYQLDENPMSDFPSCLEDLEKIIPHYQTLPGWGSYDPKKVKKLEDLPLPLQNYVHFIEDYLETPIVLVSTGAGREETLSR